MGQVVTAGAGQNPARIAAVGAGIPMNVPAATVNNVCLSGMNSIVLADQLIRSGDYDIVVAGGMESMSQAPHLLPSAFSYGDVMVHDSLERDGLWDYFTNQSMGALTDEANVNGSGISRADQDAFAVESHRRAAAAWDDGVFDDEVVPVSVPRRRGGEDVITQDEGIRADASIEALANLRPAFRPDGTMTAGILLAAVGRRSGRCGHQSPNRGTAGAHLAGGDRRPRNGRRTGLDAAVPARTCH